MGCHPFIEDEENRCFVEREPPLQVSDLKEGNQTPVLLCLEDDEIDNTHFFYGLNCTTDIFQQLESLTVDVDEDDRNVMVIFS